MSDSVKSPKSKSRKAPKPVEHPTYNDMIKAALLALKERTGTSRQAIVKYIKANYKVGDNVETQVKLALKRMATKGLLVHTKGTGASGSFKLSPAAKEVSKPKKKVVNKKPAAKKPKTAKPNAGKAKKPAAKKPAAKKPKAKKVAKPQPAKKPTAKKVAKPKSKPAKKPAAKKPVAKKPAKKAKK